MFVSNRSFCFGVLFWVLCAAGVLQAAEVATGAAHSLYIGADGTLYAAGSNSDGQLGTGGGSTSSWVQVATNVRSVVAGEAHTVFLKNDGSVWAMGRNTNGQLGDGTSTSRSLPVCVASGVKQIAAGRAHTLLLQGDFSLWCVGANESGQLGLGDTTDRTSFTRLASGVETMAAGQNHTMFITHGEAVWACGKNSAGQLGDGTKVNRTKPVAIGQHYRVMACGKDHSLLVASDGSVWGVGSNASKQLAGVSSSEALTPEMLQADYSEGMAAGNGHSLFLNGTTILWGCGDNALGAVGLGAAQVYESAKEIVGNIRAVSSTFDHTLVLKRDGTVWSFGANGSGQLADSTTTTRLSPVQVATGAGPVRITEEAELRFREAGGDEVVSVLSGGNWTVTESLDWITVNRTSGSFNGDILVTASQNPGPGARTGMIKIGTETVWIEQAAPTTQSLVAAGDLHTVWTGGDGVAWATGANSDSRLGTGSNETAADPDAVELDESPSDLVSPASQTFPAGGGTITVLRTGSDWSATTSAGWIDVFPVSHDKRGLDRRLPEVRCERVRHHHCGSELRSGAAHRFGHAGEQSVFRDAGGNRHADSDAGHGVVDGSCVRGQHGSFGNGDGRVDGWRDGAVAYAFDGIGFGERLGYGNGPAQWFRLPAGCDGDYRRRRGPGHAGA